MRRRFLTDIHGATALEYALMLGGVAVVVIGVVLLFGGDVRDVFQTTRKKLPF